MTSSNDAMSAALGELLGDDFTGMLGSVFERMGWAEDEIERAQRRHPGEAARLWHSFRLLSPENGTFDRMGTEFVYRSHCAELLERVAAGKDTRPGTAAEIILAVSKASELAPLTETASALAARMWRVAFPGQSDPWAEAREHYEALRGAQADDLEREARHKTRADGRRLGDIECGGLHHGKSVACPFATAVRLAGPVQLELILA